MATVLKYLVSCAVGFACWFCIAVIDPAGAEHFHNTLRSALHLKAQP